MVIYITLFAAVGFEVAGTMLLPLKIFKALTKHIIVTFLFIFFLLALVGDWEVTAFCNIRFMGGPWRILSSNSKQRLL